MEEIVINVGPYRMEDGAYVSTDVRVRAASKEAARAAAVGVADTLDLVGDVRELRPGYGPGPLLLGHSSGRRVRVGVDAYGQPRYSDYQMPEGVEAEIVG